MKSFGNFFNCGANFYLGKHAENVTKFSLIIGRSIGLSSLELEELAFAAKIHDIGKVFIPEEILNKPDKLTEEEWRIIKKHPLKGYEIVVKNIKTFKNVASIVSQHHEDYSGNGYPFGLKEEEIHPFARIIRIADSYDAMISYRPYKKALPEDVAKSELEKLAGINFDPYFVEVFLKSLS